MRWILALGLATACPAQIFLDDAPGSIADYQNGPCGVTVPIPYITAFGEFHPDPVVGNTVTFQTDNFQSIASNALDCADVQLYLVFLSWDTQRVGFLFPASLTNTVDTWHQLTRMVHLDMAFFNVLDYRRGVSIPTDPVYVGAEFHTQFFHLWRSMSLGVQVMASPTVRVRVMP